MTRIVMTLAGLASLLVISSSSGTAQSPTPHWIIASPGTVQPSGPAVPAGSSGGPSHLHAYPWSHHSPPPGVANDPGAIGPGHIGAGEHWVRSKPPVRAAIPGAATVPAWKSPYSYGYFGAQDKRHWSRQHGYRDKVLQWTLR